MIVTGSFGGVAASRATRIQGRFNVSLAGTFNATVRLERSFDGGATWRVCSLDGSGAPAEWTAPVEVVADEPEPALYRLNCTARASGSVAYRFGQSGAR